MFCTILLNHIQPVGSGLGINLRAANFTGGPVTYDLAQKNVLQPEFLFLNWKQRDSDTRNCRWGMRRQEPSGLGRDWFLHKWGRVLESAFKIPQVIETH